MNRVRGWPLPKHEPGSLLGPEFGYSLPTRAAEVAVAVQHRHLDVRRVRGIDAPIEQVPLPRVIFPSSQIVDTDEDRRARLTVRVELFVQDVTDELPERPRPGVRLLAIRDSASQTRYPYTGYGVRDLKPQVTFHTVTSATVEEEVLRRFDGLVERAILFGGRETLEGERH